MHVREEVSLSATQQLGATHQINLATGQCSCRTKGQRASNTTHRQFSSLRALQDSPGLGSVSRDDNDSNTFEIVSAGLHWSFNMSRQMEPFALMLGW